MKKTFLFAALFFVIAIAGFFSCEKSDKDISKQEFLQDAPNLAMQNKGFYSQFGLVDIASEKDGNQRQLIVTLHDSTIEPYQVKLYLGEKDKSNDLKSGKYEVLFLRSALILNDPTTGKKTEFIVRNDVFEDMQSKLPHGYISADARETVGIAVYGNHSNKRTDSDLVITCATSGGSGSTSCANTCCSVSCSSGYYASCQSTCTCVKSSGH